MKKIFVTGNVGRDPEVRYAPNGESFVTFSLAVTTGPKDNQKTDWLEISCNGRTAETVQKWVKKGFEEWKKGKLCVFLLPSRTDTKAFHEIILANGFEVRFVKGRLKFGNNETPAVFPSMIVIMKQNNISRTM